MLRTERVSPGQGLARVGRQLPLQLKLPLLMSAVLALVLVVTIVATYATLRSYAIQRAGDRLARSSRQLASLVTTGLTTQKARYAGIVTHPELRGALRSGQMTEAAGAALARASLPTDSGLPAELWTAEGRRIAYVGNDVRAGLTAASRPELPEPIASTVAQPGALDDSLIVTPLYGQGDRTLLWYVVPVREGNRVIGYLTHQRHVTVNQTQITLRELSGDTVSLHWRNADGAYWANAVGKQIPAFAAMDTAHGLARAENGAEVLLHEEPVPGTPLVVGLSVPARTVVAGPQRFAERLVLFGVAMLVVGTLLAWAIGRSVARPVAEVARAASSLGRGDYDVRVPETGDREMRRLAASFNTMASEIAAGRAALERQTREAQEANSAKSEFLTTMSHELRTPLNAIGGYVDLLDMELRGPVTGDQRRDLQRIKTSQQHLLGLINSVLDLSRIEAGQLAYERVHVAVDPFLAGLDVLVGPQAVAKAIELTHELRAPDLTVIADREKLRQVMINLLSNAIRHTPQGGRIGMIAGPRGNAVAIEVEDSGPGIPAEKCESVFEPFVQLDRSLSRMREGLGLGLAISRDLARGMGGDLIVEQGRTGGARFVLTLPIGVHHDAAPVSFTAETRAVG